MSRFVPESATLLQAAADYLETELLPTLDGYHRFQTRITAHTLRTVVRELQQAPALQAREHQRLAALLDHDGEPDVLRAELAAALVDGRRSADEPALLHHLRCTLQEALLVNNPKWLDEPAADTPQPRNSP